MQIASSVVRPELKQIPEARMVFSYSFFFSLFLLKVEDK